MLASYWAMDLKDWAMSLVFSLYTLTRAETMFRGAPNWSGSKALKKEGPDFFFNLQGVGKPGFLGFLWGLSRVPPQRLKKGAPLGGKFLPGNLGEEDKQSSILYSPGG